MFGECVFHRTQRQLGGLVDGIAVRTDADAWERDRREVVLTRDLQRPPVRGRQQLLLTVEAAVPHRPDGVDDEACGQPVTAGQLRVTGVAAAECSALGQEIGPRGAVDGAVDSASAEQRPVGGIDDGVDLELGDVRRDRFESLLP